MRMRDPWRRTQRRQPAPSADQEEMATDSELEPNEAEIGERLAMFVVDLCRHRQAAFGEE